MFHIGQEKGLEGSISLKENADKFYTAKSASILSNWILNEGSW
jgi:hypothetical protein